MNSQTHKELLLQLSGMTRAELEELRRVAAYQLQRKSTNPGLAEEDWILKGILIELDRRGLDNRSFQVKKTASYASFQTQSSNVRRLLLTMAPGLTAIECRALGIVAAYELARYLTWLTINRESLLMNVSRIPEAIESAYPGYMASGLLHLVIR